MKRLIKVLIILLIIAGVAVGSFLALNEAGIISSIGDMTGISNGDQVSDVPPFSGQSIISLNNDEPQFTDEEKSNSTSFERYSQLDKYGRCGVAFACVGSDLMPTEERTEIGMIRPSGWQTVRYDGLIEDNYLYNRCHLLMYALTGENANEQNLITGTRYFNSSETGGMLCYEEKVLYYMYKHPDNHVLYRVTPLFEGKNLVATGVQMEAYSVEDKGAGVSFNVFVYNVQPGIYIDYAEGDSNIDPKMIVNNQSAIERDEVAATGEPGEAQTFILNTASMKIHYPGCDSVSKMSDHNKKEVKATVAELEAKGYEPCGACNPQ